jgi:putative Mg2+ transporter-C (MgtC) family protein
VGPDLDIALVLRLVLSSVLGGMIGLEREIHGRPAGFRTHLLVSLGSCLFVLTSIEFYRIFGNFTGSAPVGVDPGRVAAQVVTGIGFLGAGAIIRERASIRGLTTAACLWVAAALGVACGIGLFYLAMTVTCIALASLLLLKELEKKLRRDKYLQVRIWGVASDDFLPSIYDVLTACEMEPFDAKFEKNTEQQRMYMEFHAKTKSPSNCGPAQLMGELSALQVVRRVKID